MRFGGAGGGKGGLPEWLPMRLPRGRTASSAIWLVPALCGFAVGFDGYDLIAYGTVIPSLLAYETWGLTPERVGLIGGYAVIGMLIGALLAGTVTDMIGRRKALLICVTWFSIFTALCGVAPSPGLFGLFRFLAGIGLGGLIPVATALTLEYAPGRRRNITHTAMMASYNVGGLLAAGLVILPIPVFGWRIMFLIAIGPPSPRKGPSGDVERRAKPAGEGETHTLSGGALHVP
jgi:AAHS family benzoate transporter-like MFS transporter